jgi:hypothetical protein
MDKMGWISDRIANAFRQLRLKAGCWVHERWRTELLLHSSVARLFKLSWRDIRNRNERLAAGSDHASRACTWHDSTFLTAARLFPRFGARICSRCFQDYPITLRNMPGCAQSIATPELSVIIPISGRERLPLFHTVLACFNGQDYRNFEIVVVGDLEDTDVAGLPLNSIHVPFMPRRNGPFCKSMLFNAGVDAARAPFVLLHDADIVVPDTYVGTTVQHLQNGWDAIQPIRFLFYFDRHDSNRLMAATQFVAPSAIADVRQNFAGGSLAVRTNTFKHIGGFDEQFIGWGGEDVEFLDRVKTTRLFSGGHAPAIHLWHPSSLTIAVPTPIVALLEEKLRTPVGDRITALRKLRLTGKTNRPAQVI